VEYPQVYPGVDLAYYGKQRELEFDFMLAPGADPGRIRLAFEGAQEALLEADGRLRLRTASGDLWLGRPRVYQKRGEKNGKSPRRSSCGARTKRASGWGRTIPNCRW